jgi:hypothetical protein
MYGQKSISSGLQPRRIGTLGLQKFDHLESAPPHTLVFTLRSLSACSLFVYSNKQTVLTPRNVKPC